MQVRYLVLFIFLFLGNLRSGAQVTFTYDPVACGVPTTNVTASISCSDTLWDAGIIADDIYSTPIPIGFLFNFYGNSYGQLVVGANGNISFTDSLAGAYAPWSIVGGLSGSTIRNSICGPWCDMNFPEYGGSCTYQRIGVAPNRKFVLTYCRVSMYNMPHCAGEWITSQIVLQETSNIVEVHITHKTVCTAWNNGRAICGVINATGSSSTIAPARDWSPNWSAANEAWRFTPVGTTGYTVAAIPHASASCGRALYWYDNLSGTYLGAGPRINIPTNVPRQLKAAVFSNCKDTSFYYITVPVPTVFPNPKEIHGPDSFCVGATAIYTDSTHGGTWSVSGNLSGTPTAGGGILVTGISDGPATVMYTLPTGCKTIKLVRVKPSPTAILPIPIIVCAGRTDTCENLIADGVWSSGNVAIATINAISGIVTGVSPGTTLITYNIRGCSVTAPMTVNPQPAGLVPADMVLCQESTMTFTNSVSGGSWSSSSPIVATIGSASGIVSALSPGTTVISYSLPTGCYSTANISVNATPGTITPSPAKVCMSTTLVLSNADLGGSWSSGNTAIATIGSGSGIATPVSPGTTFISYTFPNGCYRAVAFTVDPLPAGISPADVQVCIGNSVTYSSSPVGGTWSSMHPSVVSINATTGVATGVGVGATIITYELSAGCNRTTYVTVNALPGAITPSPTRVCMGDPFVLSNATAGGTWSSTNPAVATIGSGSGIVTTVATGTTLVSYIMPGNCYATTVVTVDPLPAAIVPASITICAGNTTILTNASGIGTWISADASIATVGSISGLVTGITPGIVSITYMLPSGCYRTMQVTVNSAPAAIAPTDGAACQGQLLFMTCATVGGTWSSNNTAVATVVTGSGVVTTISPGTAIISYILPGVCYSTDTITVRPLPALIDPANMNICQGGVDTFFSTPGGGAWSSANASIAAVGTSGIVTGGSPGTTNITYSLATGCFRTAQIYVEPASPIVPANAMICTGKEVTFTNTGTGGTWSITDPTIASISAGTSTVVATGLSPGITTLTYSFPGGCQRVATITVNTSPADITGNFKVCAQDTTTLLNTTAGTGTWSSSAPHYATVSATGMVTGTAGGTATISYKVANGCYATAVVTVFALPNAGVITGSDSICAGSAITQLTNTSGAPGLWYSSNAGTLSIDSVSGIVSGWVAGSVIITYRTLADTNGCANFITFPLYVFADAPFTIEENITTSKCYGDDNGVIFVNILNGSGGYTYKWQNGSTAPVLASLPPGSYSVVVTDIKTRCFKSKSITLTEPDSLAMTTDVGPDICSRGVGFIKVTMDGGTVPYNYTWSNDSTSADLAGLHAGNYDVTVSDKNGCNKRYTIPVRDSSGRIHIHNALSPNGDGFNDVWLIDLIEDNPYNQVQILNKWGNVVWERSGYSNDWAGVGMGEDKLPDGTYYYIVKLNNPDPKCAEAMYKGALLIKR